MKKMFNKGGYRVLTAAFGLVLVCGGFSVANAQENASRPVVTNEVVEVVEVPVPTEEVAARPDYDAYDVNEDHVPLALQEPEVFESDYGESEIARRMTQAEKNRNAAENDGWGGAITIIAMCIVISALAVLSILFMIFGKISQAILTNKKKKAKAAAMHAPTDNNELAPGEVIAAISIALMEHFGGNHDVEDTHITIKRLQKAYSPWNSKIYNLRPNLERHITSNE